MEYTIKLNAQEVSSLLNALAKFPFEHVAALIGKIDNQVAAQVHESPSVVTVDEVN